MTDDELRKLAEAALADDKTAAPAPWSVEDDGTMRCPIVHGPYDKAGRQGRLGVGFGRAEDAVLCASARTREPELARAVLRLLEERTKAALWVVIADRVPDETLVDSVWSTAEAAWTRAVEINGGCDEFGDHWSARRARFVVDGGGRLEVIRDEDTEEVQP